MRLGGIHFRPLRAVVLVVQMAILVYVVAPLPASTAQETSGPVLRITMTGDHVQREAAHASPVNAADDHQRICPALHGEPSYHEQRALAVIDIVWCAYVLPPPKYFRAPSSALEIVGDAFLRTIGTVIKIE